jgi:serine protease Do
MGMVVGADGWIITKASQLPQDGQIQCRLYDGSVIDAVECKRMVDIDLALLHIARDNLPVVKWDMSNVPDRGRWLATTDVQAGVPTAVGVVSAGAQSVQRYNAVLGVTLTRPREETSDQSGPGAYVDGVLKNTGAFLAGLRPGDLLVAVNGTSVAGLASFREAVKDRMGGDYVTLSVNRNGTLFDIEGQLMDLSEELLDDTEMEVNGTVSARASDFSRVFTHDTVLEPNQCGGPLVNLDGRVVGINIARAGRVSSYALPVDVVKPAVDSLIEQAKLVSAPAEAKSSLRPIR